MPPVRGRGTVVEVIGTSGIIANIYSADRLIREEIIAATNVAARRTKSLAQAICPVRTGRMRRSINYETTSGGFQFRVFYNMDYYTRDGVTYYAPYVEFGTRFMSARPTLIPAFEQSRSEYTPAIRSAVQGAIARIRMSRALA